MLNFWFRAVPGSEERKRTKIRFGRFLVLKNGKEPRFVSGRLPKIGRRGTKIRFRVLKNGKKRTNVRSGGLPDSEEQKNQDSFGWASDKRRNQDLFGWTLDKWETKIRSWASKEWKTLKIRSGGFLSSEERKKNQDSFSQPPRLGILDNGSRSFELAGNLNWIHSGFYFGKMASFRFLGYWIRLYKFR
ncbi:unnamed protein product [Rhizophagus irregularis]|nr:unnamed protein product [Rhizophagus irregularis]